MVTDGTTELDIILQEAVNQPDYRSGLILLIQKEHDRVNRYNRKNPPGAGDCPLVPMFSYLLERFDEAWVGLLPYENPPDRLVYRLNKSPGTLALMAMLAPETTIGQFRDAVAQMAADLTT